MKSVVVAVLALALVGCASTPPATTTTATAATSESSAGGSAAATSSTGTRSLYERLGGKPAIEAVIDDFLGNVAANERIKHRFALTDLKALRNHLVDQVCQATGGPCVYKGGDMKTVHKGQRISSADFNALVEDLVKTLDKFKVPAQEKNELLTALGSMQKDIVEVP